MFFPIIAAMVTLAGGVGLVISSLVHASVAADVVFDAGGICMVVGPLIFFSYVMIGLCIEFASTNQKPEVKTAARGHSLAVPAVSPADVAFDEDLPRVTTRAQGTVESEHRPRQENLIARQLSLGAATSSFSGRPSKVIEHEYANCGR